MIADIMTEPRVVFVSGLRFVAVEVFEQSVADSHSLFTEHFTDQIPRLIDNLCSGQPLHRSSLLGKVDIFYVDMLQIRWYITPQIQRTGNIGQIGTAI